MIISRTPFRISFFGGGTDYPAWFKEHGGSVIGAAIDKYCYISLRHLPPFFEHKSKIIYTQVELVNDAAEIQHPAVRGILTDMGIKYGLEIHHDADLPARSGLGSSSAFTVGLLNALYALDSRMVSKRDLGREAIRIEQDVLKEEVGCQDQIWAAYGGLNRIDFHPDGTFSVAPFILSAARRAELEQSLMLFFTGFSRFATDFAADQIKNMNSRRNQLRMIRSLVDSAADILLNPKTPLRELGELMHQSWRIKRELADGVSNAQIDEIYDAGREAGAIGGKLLGAGGGGFMLFIVRPEDQIKVLSALHELLLVPMQFDATGTQLIFKSVPRYSQTAHYRRDFARYMVGADGTVHADIRSLGERLRKAVADGTLVPSEDQLAAASADAARPRPGKATAEVNASELVGPPPVRRRARKK
jgi:D-glycero-alpha-D-manno-heptose-7-phosphate kinase